LFRTANFIGWELLFSSQRQLVYTTVVQYTNYTDFVLFCFFWVVGSRSQSNIEKTYTYSTEEEEKQQNEREE
jgi:hypothetical protein